MKGLAVAAAGVGVVVLAACGGGGPADLTAREISDSELAAMVLPQQDLGEAYGDLGLDEGVSGFKSNEDRIEEALEEDEAEDVERFRRVQGYDEAYYSAEAMLEGEGTVSIATSIDVFEDADGASGYLEDDQKDVQGQVGTTVEGGVLKDIEEFDPGGIGDESAGLVLTVTVPDERQVTFYMTAVRFCRGRLLGSVFINRLDEEDVREEGVALARKLDERILSVLRGETEDSQN